MLVNGSVSAMSPLPYSKQGTSPVELDSGSSPMKEDPGASAPIPSQSRKRPRLDYEDSRDMQSSSPQKAQNFVRGVDYATGANYEELSLPPSIDGLGGLNPDILQVLEVSVFLTCPPKLIKRFEIDGIAHGQAGRTAGFLDEAAFGANRCVSISFLVA
jgi:hypothetical protein